jgi:predicted DNA-binding transcriptional regulator AlpA
MSAKSILIQAAPALPAPLDPHQIVRKGEGKKYFGFGPTQLDEKIKKHEIPAPIPLSNSGRAVGWTGAMIIEHHRQLAAAAAKDQPKLFPAKRVTRKAQA